ncbi:MAG: hypothetical protein ACTH6N_04020 [Brachybacterium tyrofermentans]|uniref:hypothetical protein n=1 Tax=Brachybacterium tyrofermentans TaxID=47848 RepID=UPI000A1AADE2|nr:hypothetical protein [Brachybacterium tyrofermentans]SLN00443.1 hypothetical protein FM103_08070 [Corynebacterium xerosis]
MSKPPLELSDRDNDSLTLQADGESVWVTCTSGADEVTVGAVQKDEILDWLTETTAN